MNANSPIKRKVRVAPKLIKGIENWIKKLTPESSPDQDGFVLMKDSETGEYFEIRRVELAEDTGKIVWKREYKPVLEKRNLYREDQCHT